MQKPLMDYKYFARGGNWPYIGFAQRQHDTIMPGYAPEDSRFIVVVRDVGIVINGNCGANPPAAEIEEVTALFQECVMAWKEIFLKQLESEQGQTPDRSAPIPGPRTSTTK